MKKLSLAILTFLTTGVLSALPVANPMDASLYTNGVWWCDTGCDPCESSYSWCDAFSVRIGFWGDYVFNRHMQADDSTGDQNEIDRFSIYKNQGVITLNWCDWLDLYGLVGAANFSQRTPFLNSVTNNREMVAISYEASVCYGAGARMTVWECGCFGIGVEAQYFGSQPSFEAFTDFADGIVAYPSNVSSSTYNEWQVGLGSAYRVDTGYGNAFIPYVAIKFAGSSFDQNNALYDAGAAGTLSQSDLENSKTVGYAVGITATVCDKGGVTVEGRFADEKALFVNGQIRF